MKDVDLRPFATISLGDGWKMSLTRVNLYDVPEQGRTVLDAWCGCARTDKEAVSIYGDIEEGDPYALAEVIFEPRFQKKDRGEWVMKYAGRTYYTACPGSGQDGEAETALLSVVPLKAMIENILTLAKLALSEKTGPREPERHYSDEELEAFSNDGNE